MKLLYTNYKGETSIRDVRPLSVREGKNKWHPEVQWLILVYDWDKKATREYALKDCNFTVEREEDK